MTVLTRNIATQLLIDQGPVVIIPDIYTSIDDGAFCCNYYDEGAYNRFTLPLESIYIPEGVTEIGEGAFRGRYDLTSITIPDSVITIGRYAFDEVPLKEIEFGEGIKYIGDSAFEEQRVRSILLGNSVKYIGYSAFEGWSGGSETEFVSIPRSAKDGFIASDAFPANANIFFRGMPKDILLDGMSFDENSGDNHIVAAISTEDYLGDTHVYSLISGTLDTDNIVFSIDGNQLKIIKKPDFESKTH